MKTLMTLALFLGPPVLGQEAPPVALAALLEEARSKNPALSAARGKWRSAEALIRPARTWKDPVLGVHREEMPADSEASTHYSIEQELPFPGKLSRESRMRFHEARIAYEEYRAKEAELISGVKIQYHRLLWLERTAGVLKKDAEVLRSISQVAQSLIAAGKAGAEEALLAQTQLKEATNALYEREQRRQIEEEDLNALLAAPPGTRRRLAEPPVLAELPLSLQELEALARRKSPRYLGTHHMVHHAQLMTSKGRYGFAPDFKLSFEKEKFRRRQDETLYGLSLSLPLWFWRPAGELAAAREHTAQAVAESRDMQNEVFKELYKEYTEVRLHRDLAKSYAEEILPLAEGALKIAQKNYETGRAEYARLAQALRQWLEAQMRYYEAIYHHGEHWAMLEAVAGLEIKAGGGL